MLTGWPMNVAGVCALAATPNTTSAHALQTIRGIDETYQYLVLLALAPETSVGFDSHLRHQDTSCQGSCGRGTAHTALLTDRQKQAEITTAIPACRL